MDLFTIGFTKRSAREFFAVLRQAEVRQVIDVRLRPHSQLAGFSKSADLAYFLQALLAAHYSYEDRLAPSSDLFGAYRRGELSWDQYADGYRRRIEFRAAERILSRERLAMPTALLCSERFAEHCHRRLLVEYLAERWPDVHIVHL